MAVVALLFSCKKNSELSEQPIRQEQKTKKQLIVPYDTAKTLPTGKTTIFNPSWCNPSQLALHQENAVFLVPYRYYEMNVPGFVVFNQVLDQATGGTHVQVWDYFETNNQKWRIKAEVDEYGQRYYHIWNVQTGQHLGFGSDNRAYVYNNPVKLYITTGASNLGFWISVIKTWPTSTTCMDVYNNIPGPNGQWVGLNPINTDSETQKWGIVFTSVN